MCKYSFILFVLLFTICSAIGQNLLVYQTDTNAIPSPDCRGLYVPFNVTSDPTATVWNRLDGEYAVFYQASVSGWIIFGVTNNSSWKKTTATLDVYYPAGDYSVQSLASGTPSIVMQEDTASLLAPDMITNQLAMISELQSQVSNLQTIVSSSSTISGQLTSQAGQLSLIQAGTSQSANFLSEIDMGTGELVSSFSNAVQSLSNMETNGIKVISSNSDSNYMYVAESDYDIDADGQSDNAELLYEIALNTKTEGLSVAELLVEIHDQLSNGIVIEGTSDGGDVFDDTDTVEAITGVETAILEIQNTLDDTYENTDEFSTNELGSVLFNNEITNNVNTFSQIETELDNQDYTRMETFGMTNWLSFFSVTVPELSKIAIIEVEKGLGESSEVATIDLEDNEWIPIVRFVMHFGLLIFFLMGMFKCLKVAFA